VNLYRVKRSEVEAEEFMPGVPLPYPPGVRKDAGSPSGYSVGGRGIYPGDFVVMEDGYTDAVVMSEELFHQNYELVTKREWTIGSLVTVGRNIWGPDRLTLKDVVIRLGVGFGDLCRIARGADKDRTTEVAQELKKELGNIIASTLRWCDDLGFDPEECIELGLESQRRFAEQNTRR